MNKRTFLKTLSLSAAAIAAVPLNLFAKPTAVPVAVPTEGIKAIKVIGYHWFEWPKTDFWRWSTGIMEQSIKNHHNGLGLPLYAVSIKYIPEEGQWVVVSNTYLKSYKKSLMKDSNWWNGIFGFHKLFDPQEVSLLDKNKRYTTFVPLRPDPE